MNGVTALVCARCHAAVGCRNADSSPDYLCAACRGEIAQAEAWIEVLLDQANREGISDWPGLEMAAQQQQMVLAMDGPWWRMLFARETVFWAAVAYAQGTLTRGDVVALRDEMAALCGLLPAELVVMAAEKLPAHEVVGVGAH